jgi:hypothetical protein
MDVFFVETFGVESSHRSRDDYALRGLALKGLFLTSDLVYNEIRCKYLKISCPGCSVLSPRLDNCSIFWDAEVRLW